MSGFLSIPSRRVSDLMIQSQLTAQLQYQQSELLRLEDAVSSGQRLARPSDEPSTAIRAIALQRLIEQKDQIQTNLTTNQSYLTATDNTLAGVSQLLIDLRGRAVEAADGTLSATQRDALAAEIGRGIDQLLALGAEKFRGRFLFAGVDPSAPFEAAGSFVAYRGNASHYQSYSDVGVLLETNVSGDEAFGAISQDAAGADLDPMLTPETRLADLRGGRGVTPGSFIISDGFTQRTIDISAAETVGDLADLIQSNPPEGRQVDVRIEADHLEIQLDPAAGGNLAIREVNGGRTAAELGILQPMGVGAGSIIGGDLDPLLQLTTRLDDILGGTFDRDSGIRIVQGGETYVVQFGAAETIEDLLNLLNASGADLVAEINQAGDGLNVRSRLSGADFQIGENGGQTATQLGIRTFAGQTLLADLNHRWGVRAAEGPDFVIRRKDGVDLEIDVSDAATIQDVLDRINNHPDNLDPSTAVVARLASMGNGIELADNNTLAPGSLTVTPTFGSDAAWDLGLVPRGDDQTGPTGSAAPASVSLSFPPPRDQNTAMRITAAQPGESLNGVAVEFRDLLVGDSANAVFDPVAKRLTIDIDAAQTTANTVVAAIMAEGTFSASLDLSQDPTNDGSGVIGAVGVAGLTSGGTAETVTGTDTNPLEVRGAFNSLLRLREAVLQSDSAEIERAAAMLDEDLDRVNFVRADLGAQQDGLEAIGQRVEGEKTELKGALSEEIDTDLAEALSDFSARQAAMEATLRLFGQAMQLTLIDFL